MSRILVIIYPGACRLWETRLLARLSAIGCDVHIRHSSKRRPQNLILDGILTLEKLRFGSSAAAWTAAVAERLCPDPDLVIDLTGSAEGQPAPVVTIGVGGCSSVEAGLRQLRSDGRRIEITARLNGRAVATASPMISDRTWLSRDIDQLLSAVQSLLAGVVMRFARQRLAIIDEPQHGGRQASFPLSYAESLVRGLGRRLMKRLRGTRPFYWQTAYRFIDGPGIAETGMVKGEPFTVIADDGNRFYADPFPFLLDGRYYLFVEEFPYAEGRGIISVAEEDGHGRFGLPRPVLIEGHHLSYPNVFTWHGEIFMIPEGCAAREVTLYRAENFPGGWVRDTVLLEGLVFNDATLVERDGLIWLFGTQQYERGSASDALVAYFADNIRGPWQPHPLNPVVIDQSGARPGGRIVEIDGRQYLPVQDGSRGYGTGLGLREIVELSMDDIRLGPVLPVAMGAAWDRQGIHTLNRAGRLEVIDSTR